MPLGIPRQYRTIDKHEGALPPCNAESYAAQLLERRQSFEAVYPVVDLIMVLTVLVILLSAIALHRPRT